MTLSLVTMVKHIPLLMNRKYAQSELPKADKDLNPINQDVPFIGRDGKTYYSLEELNRADIMFENRQIINSSLPKIAENEAFEESTVDYDTEGYHKSR